MPGTPWAPSARIADWIGSPSTSQLASRSAAIASGTASRPVEAAGDVVDGEQRVAERRADVALHRGVGEVALQAALHEGRGQHVEQGVADLEVGLGVLEADRVDLVRHVVEPDRALAAHLGEVAHRDVGPHVGAEVVQHPVEARDVGVELGLPVVALDLGGERVPGEAEALDERPADLRPVGVRHGGDVGAVGAGGAVELAEELGGLDARAAGAAAASASTASSLPIVVGVAGWPWVWASSGTSRRSDGHRGELLDDGAWPRGSHTSRTAPLTMTAYERLLTSSLVQQKWMSSARPGPRAPGRSRSSRFLRKYSTALTSCWVTRSVARHLVDLGGAEVVARRRAGPPARRSVRRAHARARRSCSVRWISHSTSTCTRARLSAGSERWSTSGATTPR